MAETAPAAAPADPTSKPTVEFADFARLDLRVARIIKAEPHPNADKLLRLQLDDGSGKPRQICAGIKEHYTNPAELEGTLIVIVANLAPRTIRGEESRGMLLAASDMPKTDNPAAENRKVILVRPSADIAPGAQVS